jgi:sugar phosphate isomerase/epimerase
MTRRQFVRQAAAASLALAPRPARMGIASTSFSGGASDALAFLERCHALGAGGIQTRLTGDLGRLRRRAEELGMFVEGMAPLPRDGQAGPFERALHDARAAGATVVRVAALPGRRYETFPSPEAWNEWKQQTLGALKQAVETAERQKFPFALENHKDWTLDELAPLVRGYSSEYFGVCFDFGNNIAMLDDPLEMAETLAPYILSTHVKDMAVAPYEDGFLLSEVPLGQGILDLTRMVAAIRKVPPRANFSLEMITRDPLKVPCLTERYWAPFPERSGRYLARTWKLIRERAARSPLPAVSQLSREHRLRLEEDNVKACLAYARAQWSL